jgi:hypothetical protein
MKLHVYDAMMRQNIREFLLTPNSIIIVYWLRVLIQLRIKLPCNRRSFQSPGQSQDVVTTEAHGPYLISSKTTKSLINLCQDTFVTTPQPQSYNFLHTMTTTTPTPTSDAVRVTTMFYSTPKKSTFVLISLFLALWWPSWLAILAHFFA